MEYPKWLSREALKQCRSVNTWGDVRLEAQWMAAYRSFYKELVMPFLKRQCGCDGLESGKCKFCEFLEKGEL